MRAQPRMCNECDSNLTFALAHRPAMMEGDKQPRRAVGAAAEGCWPDALQPSSGRPRRATV